MKLKTMSKPVFDGHAVRRILERRLPVEAVEQIAQVGVTVQENGTRVMKRGDVNGKPVHVVLAKPNTIITVYSADEWESTVAVRRKRQ
ncbi:DUF4258 domain-containing protein [Alicyclobacillus macrosporangiidus]|jgi:hypothetical protein|uniref:DUF4258 domain-containing protein n=1 Tax=Alicyclobacillus macrosporangiidus TaxID=392015 RepID=A0A1I7KEM2_9BACL|nr:DUF4258 domain-containing protein [Alicyclobacillus macrosporangiidus]SFU95941.1 hypothetical protein SAMN05421543_11584 [Alicyclobacillus macrosporangiidus]